MKLEKFVKSKKQKKIIVLCLIGLVLLIGGITLYRTYALYEENKEFNVLRGRVPDFGKDIKIAFLDGETKVDIIPKKEDGKVFIGYECNKEKVSIKWDYANWAPIVLNLNEKGTSCTLKFEAGKSISNVSVGDYISYTPSKTSYIIANRLTGMDTYSGTGTISNSVKEAGKQTINPSELSLWRVIRKNEDGTVDVVSEYVSSKAVYFYGKTGYEKLIGNLNRIAESYETEGITVGSRHMGYDGQTENIITSNEKTAPWPNRTSSNNLTDVNQITVESPNGSERERRGGGDYGYLTDYNLVKNVIGTEKANKVGTTTATTYWFASRWYNYNTPTVWYYAARRLNADDGLPSVVYLYSYENDLWKEATGGYAIRPIVTLSKGLVAIEGTLDTKKMWIIN